MAARSVPLIGVRSAGGALRGALAFADAPITILASPLRFTLVRIVYLRFDYPEVLDCLELRQEVLQSRIHL